MGKQDTDARPSGGEQQPPNYDVEVDADELLADLAKRAADYAHDHDEKRRWWRESFDMVSEFHDARYWMLEALGGRRAYQYAMVELQPGGRYRNDDGTVDVRGFMSWLSDLSEEAHEAARGDYTTTREADEAETAYVKMQSVLRDDYDVGWPRFDEVGGVRERDLP
jgi:hypothetical protein